MSTLCAAKSTLLGHTVPTDLKSTRPSCIPRPPLNFYHIPHPTASVLFESQTLAISAAALPPDLSLLSHSSSVLPFLPSSQEPTDKQQTKVKKWKNRQGRPIIMTAFQLSISVFSLIFAQQHSTLFFYLDFSFFLSSSTAPLQTLGKAKE